MPDIREFATWGIDEPLRVRKWVPLEDYEQLRGNLSLAEEGLANATQEIEQLHASLRELGKNVYGGRWVDHAGGCTAGVDGHVCNCGLSDWLVKHQKELGLVFPVPQPEKQT